MKNLNCTQCGAPIHPIFLKDRRARCDYCKAGFLLPEEKRPVSAGLSFGVITASDPDGDDPELGPLAKAVGVIFLLAIIVFGGIKMQEHVRSRPDAERKADEARLREANTAVDIPVTIEWEGGTNEVLHYKMPAVNPTTFAIARGLQKAPGTKQVVVVRVTIDGDGRVIEAEMVSGNIMLQRFATESAGTTVFSPNPKKRTRTITYTFG